MTPLGRLINWLACATAAALIVLGRCLGMRIEDE